MKTEGLSTIIEFILVSQSFLPFTIALSFCCSLRLLIPTDFFFGRRRRVSTAKSEFTTIHKSKPNRKGAAIR